MDDSLDSKQKDLVLIIEDDERLANLTREYLEANGFRVAIEADGAHGVERILELEPDIVPEHRRREAVAEAGEGTDLECGLPTARVTAWSGCRCRRPR